MFLKIKRSALNYHIIFAKTGGFSICCFILVQLKKSDNGFLFHTLKALGDREERDIGRDVFVCKSMWGSCMLLWLE